MEGRVANLIEGFYGGMFPKQFGRNTFNEAGQDSFTLPPGQNPDLFQKLANCMPVTRGVLERRWGYPVFSTAVTAAPTYMQSYRGDTANVRKLFVSSTGMTQVLNEDGTNFRTTLFTPAGGAVAPRFVNSRDYAYIFDGVSGDLKKWDGGSATTITLWGIVAPATAVSVSAPIGSGSINLAEGRNYFVVYRNSTTGHRSDLNPVSASTGPLVNQNINLSSIPISSDGQVDQKDILATLDGGDQTSLYFLASVANATTTYTDSTTEATLSASNVYQQIDDSGIEHGVNDNTPPPNCTYFIKHRGRIYGILNQYLYFSKSIDEVTTSTGTIVAKYEECWPATNFLEVSRDAERLIALLSDGRNLYVGTERKIHRISGDGPNNFEIPETVFAEVGVLNQDVWQVTYLEGQPVGAMWLTPDYRVIGSDFNTYQDAGTPVQDLLNLITSTTPTPVATFYANAQYDFFLLAIPTSGNTLLNHLLIFDLRRKVWHDWTFFDAGSFYFYNVTQGGVPQLLWPDALGVHRIYGPIAASSTQDRGLTSIDSIIQTSWLDFGDAGAYKILNELEVMTADSGMLVTVEGASTAAQFTTPRTVVSNAALVTGPLGVFKKYLAGSTTRDRWYRFKFDSTATTSPVLDYFRVDYSPINRI